MKPDPDYRGAVELSPRVWWVGSMLPGDQFQCHVVARADHALYEAKTAGRDRIDVAA